MNPYLSELKTKRGVPHPLPLLTEVPSVSIGSDPGTPVSEITDPSGSNGSTWGIPFSKAALVKDFMDIDGLSLEAAENLAVQCQPPRPAEGWLAMIAELDRLIALACKRDGVDAEACERILAGRRCQALSTIPATLQWFRSELA